ncbi:MAG: hypothetical protein VYC34_04615, partial [Planctomycetota bacterium]|nr:hypothetical protein [Planctomycetota bacterium]
KRYILEASSRRKVAVTERLVAALAGEIGEENILLSARKPDSIIEPRPQRRRYEPANNGAE